MPRLETPRDTGGRLPRCQAGPAMGSPGPEALILPLSLLSREQGGSLHSSLGLEAQCP